MEKNREGHNNVIESRQHDGVTSNEVKNKAKIHNLIIVDESGSMVFLRQSTLSGINEIINTIKSMQNKYVTTQTHTLTLVTFASNSKHQSVITVIDDKPIEEVEKFTDYNPFGGTPLYDALGKSLTTLHSRIKDDEDATGVVTVLTDGEENCSREWDLKSIGKLIMQLKTEGWTFSYMGSTHDVKCVTERLHIDNVIEFAHNEEGITNTWQRERGARISYYDKMDKYYKQHRQDSKEEKIRRRRQYSKEYYVNRVTPNYITQLEPDEIFVFGSDAYGMHGGGAARMALEHFGAVVGKSEGPQGRSYAIPTTEGLYFMQMAVERFIRFAHENPHLRFLVTRIGCGSAGYSKRDVARLFQPCIYLENVNLPEDFWYELGLKI